MEPPGRDPLSSCLAPTCGVDLMPDETIPLVARLFRVLVILFDEALTAAGGSGDIIIGALVALLVYRYSAVKDRGGSGSSASATPGRRRKTP